MITVQLNKRDFEYDIYSLVKAFYPGEDVSICYEDTVEDAVLKISVFYGENKIFIDFDSQNSSGMATGCVELSQADDRKETKNKLKRILYQMLKKHTGQELPWGNLTGIRPTKIPMALLEKGWKNSQIAGYMRDNYYTSNEKTALAVMIANRERHLLKEINYENGYSLYVGIPFCPSICLYCSFSSSPLGVWKERVDEYLDALCREIEEVSGTFSGKELNTVYIGGGTPTTLEPDQMNRLLTKLEDKFDYSHLKEFTVEAGRPDSITEAKLQVLLDHNVSRISINPQTMNQKTLDLIGRRHTVGETVEAKWHQHHPSRQPSEDDRV